MNIAVVSADKEYLCTVRNNSRKRKFGTYQVTTYEACAFRMSTMGTLPIGTLLDMRMAASPA